MTSCELSKIGEDTSC